jgi:hypothetical protein
MNIADFINGSFECLGGILVALSIRRLWRDKIVRGVSAWPVAFFMTWSLWNLWYYPSLHQWWSFVGGAGVLVSNTIYCVLMFYYLRLEKKGLTPPDCRGRGRV